MNARDRQKLKPVLETIQCSAEAVIVSSVEGYILDANESAHRIYKRSPGGLKGKHPLILCREDFSLSLSQEIFRCTHTTGRWKGVIVNGDAEGVDFPILLKTLSLKHCEGLVYATVAFATPFPPETPFNLKPKQAEVFNLLGEGKDIKDICELLQIARSSLNGRVDSILEKIRKDSGYLVRDAKSLQNLAIHCRAAGWNSSLRLHI